MSVCLKSSEDTLMKRLSRTNVLLFLLNIITMWAPWSDLCSLNGFSPVKASKQLVIFSCTHTPSQMKQPLDFSPHCASFSLIVELLFLYVIYHVLQYYTLGMASSLRQLLTLLMLDRVLIWDFKLDSKHWIKRLNGYKFRTFSGTFLQNRNQLYVAFIRFITADDYPVQ